MKISIATLPVTYQITPMGLHLTNGQYDFLLTQTEKYRKQHKKIDWNKTTELFNKEFNTKYSLEKIKKTNSQFSKKNIQIWKQSQNEECVGIKNDLNTSLEKMYESQTVSKVLEEKKLQIQSSIFQDVINITTSSKEIGHSNDSDSSNNIDSFSETDSSNQNPTSTHDELDPFSIPEIVVNENEEISKYLN